MHKREYEIVAKTFALQIHEADQARDAQSVTTLISTVKALAVEFGKDNPSFDYWKFFNAATGTLTREEAV